MNTEKGNGSDKKDVFSIQLFKRSALYTRTLDGFPIDIETNYHKCSSLK